MSSITITNPTTPGQFEDRFPRVSWGKREIGRLAKMGILKQRVITRRATIISQTEVLDLYKLCKSRKAKEQSSTMVKPAQLLNEYPELRKSYSEQDIGHLVSMEFFPTAIKFAHGCLVDKQETMEILSSHMQ